MKTIVLMGISCLMLAGVYGVMNKESAVSKILSFSQAKGAASPIDTGEKEKANNGLVNSKEHKASASTTLDDSHWIDDPLFEKAAGGNLITDNEVELRPEKSNSETIKQAEPEPEAKQLILELDADSTIQQVPIESI